MSYQRHFLSACWPEISGEDFEYLKDSISISGLRDSIVLLDGEILDGWNRYRACQATGIEPHFVSYEGDDPSQYVRDKHTRRSLTLTQRLTCIGLMATWAPSSRPNKGDLGSPLLKKDLAKQAGSSERTAQRVMSVIKSGDTETIKEMIDGTLSAKAADAKVKGHTEKPVKPSPVVEPKEPSLADQVREETGAGDFDAAASEVQELRSGYLLVAEENQRLLDENAALKADGTTEEQDAAQALIAELRETSRIQGLELDAVKVSRDIYLNENAQLKKQIKFYQRKLKELEA